MKRKSRQKRERQAEPGSSKRPAKTVRATRASEPDTTWSEDEGGVSPSHLLTIPPELRDHILAYVLVSSDFVIDIPRYLAMQYTNALEFHDRVQPNKPFQRLDFDESGAERSVSAYVALSSTCRQLYHEAKPCFFGGNAFAACLFTGSNLRILPLCDADLVCVKRFLLYRYGGLSRDWLTPNAVPTTLDVRLKGTTIQAQITCGCDILAESVLAAYPGGRISPCSREEDQEIMEARTRTAIEEFKQAVQGQGKLTREVLNRLREAIIEAW